MRHKYKQENKILIQIIKDIIWMAVRYAHGRHTYAPSMVRDAMREFKKICPEYRYRDITIEAPEMDDLISAGSRFREDWLDDLIEKEMEEK